MNNEKDELKECIAREFEEIAKEEEESLEKDTSLVVPEGTKEAVLARLKEQMREYQREQAENEAREREEAINNLSEEDRRALELGRKMLKAEVGTADTSEKKVHYSRKPLKIYLALAAVIVCVLAMGITSMGGPERVVRMVRQAVGDREVEKNSTSRKIKTIASEDEEKAYQEIRDAFDTDVVKIFVCLPDMKFDTMNLDESKQVAEMYYSYDGETIGYIINMPYRDQTMPRAQMATPMRPEARAPILVTIGPEVGRVSREPREAMSSIVPIVAGVSPRSSRTSGRRESHADVPKPRHT